MSKVWVVGEYIKKTRHGGVWDFMGVFTDENIAVGVCKGHKNRFVGPAELNKVLPDMRTVWDGCYYPEFKGASNA